MRKATAIRPILFFRKKVSKKLLIPEGDFCARGRHKTRLKNWKLDKKTMRMPGVVGRYTNDIVYDRLAPGIFDELKKINPVQENGRRKSKHHSWLTQETGHPALDKHFTGILALMRAHTDWEHFKRSLARAYPKIGTGEALKQLAMQFGEND